MITIATLLWQPNSHSRDFSKAYTGEWVDRLYRSFAKHTTRPFRFVCFVDREYTFIEPVIQERIRDPKPSYATCIEPYRLNEPMILVGLDTVVTGNIDHLIDHCLTTDKFALPRDPYNKKQACNGVALVPVGHRHVWEGHTDQNDMVWVRQFPHDYIDDLFPGQVVSFKGDVLKNGLGDARIVYFHGEPKAASMTHLPWIKENWS